MALTQVSRGLLSTSIVDNGNATAITIDSNENVLVGKSTTAFGTAGLRFAPTGAIDATVSGDGSLFLNRLSSDGGMSYFYKDGSNVGTIGTLLGNLTVGTGDTGVQFNKDVNALIPHNVATGANVDNSIDLGYSDGASTNLRFKDLYLSGTANVGSQVKFNAHSGYDERTIGLDSTGLYVYNATDSRYDLSIDASGNLLVGTTTVNAGGRLLNLKANLVLGSFYRDSSTTNDSAVEVRSNVGGTNTVNFQVDADGDVTNTNNSYGSISDERLKSNIVDAASQLDDIMAVQVRSYTLDSTGDTHIGVVAQELESAGMSGLVQEDKEGMKSVKYSVLYMKSLKALQEAVTRIENLEERLTALENN